MNKLLPSCKRCAETYSLALGWGSKWRREGVRVPVFSRGIQSAVAALREGESLLLLPSLGQPLYEVNSPSRLSLFRMVDGEQKERGRDWQEDQVKARAPQTELRP